MKLLLVITLIIFTLLWSTSCAVSFYYTFLRKDINLKSWLWIFAIGMSCLFINAILLIIEKNF